MVLSNREAYEMRQRGHNVIVECGDCGRQVWTDDGTYIVGEDEWYCASCNDRLVEGLIDLDEDDGGASEP